MFALEGIEIFQATPLKLGVMCGNGAIITYVQQFYSSTHTYRSQIVVQRRFKCSIPGNWNLVRGTRHIQAQPGYTIRGMGVYFARKSFFEQGLPDDRQVLHAEQRLPHGTEEKEKRSFPMEHGSIAKHHPAWKPQCTQESRQPLCPKTEGHATLQSG